MNDVCHGLCGRLWGVAARVFCHPEYRAMIMVGLCVTLLDYIFQALTINKVEQFIIDSLFSVYTFTPG